MIKKYRIKSHFRFITFLTTLMLVLMFGTATILGANTATCLSDTQKDNFNSVTVAYGDTLWNIAETYGPKDQDVRKTVYMICELNNISAEELMPGEILTIPA